MLRRRNKFSSFDFVIYDFFFLQPAVFVIFRRVNNRSSVRLFYGPARWAIERVANFANPPLDELLPDDVLRDLGMSGSRYVCSPRRKCAVVRAKIVGPLISQLG